MSYQTTALQNLKPSNENLMDKKKEYVNMLQMEH
jgi:hypothetical protein